jgi:hypothetical protein
MPSEETVDVSPNDGNADIGQRDSGYLVVSFDPGSRTLCRTRPSRKMKLGHGQTRQSWGVCESALKSH